MTRDDITEEIQRRLSSITIVNGYSFDIVAVRRNPEVPPDPNHMPCAHLFEAGDRVVKPSNRGASQPPIYKRRLSHIVEYWYKSTSDGQASKDISLFLAASRYALFNDGITLGGYAAEFSEVETTRVLRPGISNYVIGIGCTYSTEFVEDFNSITI